MFEVYVWDFEGNPFYDLCTEEAYWTAIDTDDDHEQSIEMVGARDEDA